MQKTKLYHFNVSNKSLSLKSDFYAVDFRFIEQEPCDLAGLEIVVLDNKRIEYFLTQN